MNQSAFLQSFENLKKEVHEIKILQQRVLFLLEQNRLISTENKYLLDDWISVKESCSILNCSEVTLWKLRKDGIIPFTKIKRTIRFKKIDILNYLNQQG